MSDTQSICSQMNIESPNPLELLQLNDDCILHILKFIPFTKLVHLHGTLCQRLDMLIMIQLRRFRNYVIFMREPTPFNDEQLELIGLNLTFLHLSVGYGIPPEEPVKIMRPLFKGAVKTGKLKSFEIQYIFWSQSHIDVVKQIMPQLEYLDLSRSDFYSRDQLKQLLDLGTNLKVLKIKTMSCGDIFHCVEFSGLKVIEIHDDGSNLEMCKKISAMYPDLEIAHVSPFIKGAEKYRYWVRGEETFK